VVILDARAPHLTGADNAQAAMLGAGAADVDTVIVGGVIRKRDGCMVADAYEKAAHLLAASPAHLS
jgi:5-methylthioadenosine/S-adenosylhomocysteine deaminase